MMFATTTIPEVFALVRDKMIMEETPNSMDLATVVVFMAVFWAIFFAIFCNIIRYIVRDYPLLAVVAEREYNRGAKKAFQDAGEPMTREEFMDYFLNSWPWLQVVYFQHLCGALLCAPSVFNIVDPATGTSLVCLAILSEMGWELQDIISWIIVRLRPLGKHRAPIFLIVMLALHHGLTTILGVPMILNYRDEKTLHWLCFDLQMAAAVGQVAIEYTKLLDVSKPNELLRFQFISCLSFALIVWARVIDWFYLMARFMMIWYRDEAWAFLVSGGILSVFFSLFSIVAVVLPFYARLRKFFRTKAVYESAPTEDLRRSSLMELSHAALELAAMSSPEEEFVATYFPARRVSRRSTMPPPSRGKTLSSVAPTRASMIEMRKPKNA